MTIVRTLILCILFPSSSTNPAKASLTLDNLGTAQRAFQVRDYLEAKGLF